MNTTIVQIIYAPTSTEDLENVEKFYGKLQELIEQMLKGDVLIIMGDWSTTIGEAGAPGIA